ncbi:MAG TPA: hypothetical protein VJ385_20845 [Fibrobacteria bacterium]|nr:hypothetical protein [Fibrobacteria bacterium]
MQIKIEYPIEAFLLKRTFDEEVADKSGATRHDANPAGHRASFPSSSLIRAPPGTCIAVMRPLARRQEGRGRFQIV